TKDDKSKATALNRIGATYYRMTEIDKALDYAGQGLAIAEELNVPNLIIDCYGVISTILEKKGDFSKALEYYKKYKEFNDKAFTEENSKKYNELQVSYETEKKEKENEIYRLKNIELVKANEDLKKALAEVNTLSGLLPICASCKKIRDDSGYWEQIEEYISRRSDTQFSHGLCPECMKKLYPEYSNFVD
ncbi:MAG: tetratricopeptide repeat protein, partial [Candidatus Aegiribacteria sp.]|nr:tetratricopeptide repeat protein [Candidatus Aegiribacteria sp.]